MRRSDGRDGEGTSEGSEKARDSQSHFGGMDDTGGLGAVNPGTTAPKAGQVNRLNARIDDDPGTYEDANITGSDVTSGMGRSPRGRTPGRTGRQSDDPEQDEDDLELDMT